MIRKDPAMAEPTATATGAGGRRPDDEYDWLILRGRVFRIGRLEVWALIAANAAGWVGLLWVLHSKLGEIAQVLRVR